MTQAVINNAIVLYELSIDRESVEAANRLYDSEPALKKVLESPVVPMNKKKKIINEIFSSDNFPKELKNFLMIMSDYGQIEDLDEIFQAYYQYWDEKHNILRAELIFPEMRDENEIKQAQEFLKKKYPDKQVISEIKIDSDIIGGILIRVNQEEYDLSYEGRLKQLERKLTGR